MQTFIKTIKSILIIVVIAILPFCSSATTTSNNKHVWDDLRKIFKLNINVKKESIKKYEAKYAAQNFHIEKISRNAEQYLYVVYNMLKQENMPGELALLPIIESDFRAHAVSSCGNDVGFWQIASRTGKILGLKDNQWVDERKDIEHSTRAAIQLLKDLYRKYGSWELALAAYNCGPVRVDKEIKANKAKNLPTSYWDLNIPKVTKAYVPKLFGLARIVKNPNKYKLKLHPTASKPHHDQVLIKNTLDLTTVSKLSQVPVTKLKTFNPSLKTNTIHKSVNYKLRLPIGKGKHFDNALEKHLANKSTISSSNKSIHIVKSGDSLSKLASQHKTSIKKLKELNGLKSNVINIGSKLKIPHKIIPKIQTPPTSAG